MHAPRPPMSQQVEPLLLTTAEAAQRLAISPRQMRNLVAEGRVRSITIGRSRRIPVEQLHRFIAEQREEEA